MKRFTIIAVATLTVGTWLAPSSAQAQPLRRFFNRLFGGGETTVRYVETDTGRRYSYEPSMEPATEVRSYRSREATKSPWMYPKSDPRRYRN